MFHCYRQEQVRCHLSSYKQLSVTPINIGLLPLHPSEQKEAVFDVSVHVIISIQHGVII